MYQTALIALLALMPQFLNSQTQQERNEISIAELDWQKTMFMMELMKDNNRSGDDNSALLMFMIMNSGFVGDRVEEEDIVNTKPDDVVKEIIKQTVISPVDTVVDYALNKLTPYEELKTDIQPIISDVVKVGLKPPIFNTINYVVDDITRIYNNELLKEPVLWGDSNEWSSMFREQEEMLSVYKVDSYGVKEYNDSEADMLAYYKGI